MRARGVSPCSSTARSDATSKAAAPSLIWLDTAAVSRPPSVSVGSDCILSKDVSRRGPSSVVTPLTGSISASKRPSSMARMARRWLSSA